jgi:hypothetical protein
MGQTLFSTATLSRIARLSAMESITQLQLKAERCRVLARKVSEEERHSFRLMASDYENRARSLDMRRRSEARRWAALSSSPQATVPRYG